ERLEGGRGAWWRLEGRRGAWRGARRSALPSPAAQRDGNRWSLRGTAGGGGRRLARLWWWHLAQGHDLVVRRSGGLKGGQRPVKQLDFALLVGDARNLFLNLERLAFLLDD